MKLNNLKLAGLLTGIYLTFASFSIYAEEGQGSDLINKDQVEGRVEEGKGKVKEVTGNVIGDTKMEVEGNIQKNLGKAQADFGDLKQDIKNGK